MYGSLVHLEYTIVHVCATDRVSLTARLHLKLDGGFLFFFFFFKGLSSAILLLKFLTVRRTDFEPLGWPIPPDVPSPITCYCCFQIFLMRPRRSRATLRGHFQSRSEHFSHSSMPTSQNSLTVDVQTFLTAI